MPYFFFQLYTKLPAFMQRLIFWLVMACYKFELAFNLADHMSAKADNKYIHMNIANLAHRALTHD